MARNYFAAGSVGVGSGVTAISVVGGTTIRPRIYEILIGCAAAPADAATEWAAQRLTADGTGTSVTPTALDPGDPSAIATSKKTYTIEPTYTANALLFDEPVNQRASFRWVAVPGKELVVPNTSANGIGIRSIQSTVSTTHQAAIYWEE